MESLAFLLTQRGVIEVKGPDALSFLQGLVTNDVERAAGGRAVYAALLTPQGKIVADFIIAPFKGGYWLDCAASYAADLTARLKKYRLRAKVEIADRSAELAVAALCPGQAMAGDAVSFPDPRLAALGWRVIDRRSGLEAALGTAGYRVVRVEAYERRRLVLGVPDSTDIAPETLFPLDCNFEELNGVDFKKGCYVGQELTARMKHRASARKRFLPVDADVELPAPGTSVTIGEAPVGELKSSIDRQGLALIRLDRLGAAKEAVADGVVIRVGAPAYPLILSQGDNS